MDLASGLLRAGVAAHHDFQIDTALAAFIGP
jgi:hypothetical protein